MPPYILGLAMAVLSQLYYKLWNICPILSLDYLVGPLPKDNVVGPLPDPNIVRINYTTTCNILKLCLKFYIIPRLSRWLLSCWLLPENNNVDLCQAKYSQDIQLYTTGGQYSSVPASILQQYANLSTSYKIITFILYYSQTISWATARE